MSKIYKINLKLFVILFAISFSVRSKAEELPRATTSNCFYIQPIFEGIHVLNKLTYAQKEAEFIKMKSQLGNGNLYHRLGFSAIYDRSEDLEWRDDCKLAIEYGVHLGLIYGFQTHTDDGFRAVAMKDLRLFQWRKDGVDWKGAFTSTGTLEVPEDQRDYKVPTPSRYATPLLTYNVTRAKTWAIYAKKLMDDFPGVISVINGPIEEELAIGGNANTDKLADYSPYAITEFRDWLLHKELYDDVSGKFAGEGANNFIVGTLININGALRSQFYDDPTPADSNGTGVSFNSYFGTNFSSWSLRYWDLVAYPAAITDQNFDCTPEAGNGFTAGGFDAPRILDASSGFWSAWSYDIGDQGVNPFGNPTTPAFGFRQTMVHNFVRDLSDVMASAGIPREMIYAHQIPGEALGVFNGSNTRERSSASPVWSGLLEKSNTVGITRFGSIDPKLLTQYADNWGIFEWHTKPNAAKMATKLYDFTKTDLTSYYANKCHYLFPGWWQKDSVDRIFPLNDSNFAIAISDFIKSCAEVPYNQQGTDPNFTPPVVSNVYGYLENGTLNVNWNNKIWSDLLQKWSDWGMFSSFEFQKSVDGVTWESSQSVSTNQFSQAVFGSSYKIRVRAVSKTGLFGAWSPVMTVDSSSPKVQFDLTAQSASMLADPTLSNLITIKLKDSSKAIDPASLVVSITGNGSITGLEPANAGTIEKFWHMNSLSEVTSLNRLDNAVCTNGVFQATVSPITPIDPNFTFSNSAINGSLLPYISIRMYSEVATNGQIFFFYSGGNKSNSFPIIAGWNTYSFANVPNWIALTNVTSIRLDPGNNNPSKKIMVDWMAVSSQPISQNMVVSPTIIGNVATFTTIPTVTPGSYTVSVSINGSQQSVVVNTNTNTVTADVLLPKKTTLLFPNPVKDWVTLRLTDRHQTKVQIMTINGQIIKSIALGEQENPTFSVSNLPKGLYVVQIQTGGETIVERMIKQ